MSGAGDAVPSTAAPAAGAGATPTTEGPAATATDDLETGAGDGPAEGDSPAEGDGPANGDDGRAEGGGAPAGSRRVWPGVLLRAVVVLVVSAVGYALVVPVAPLDGKRLNLLVEGANGTTDFRGRPHLQQKAPSSFAIPAISADAKAHPRDTGLVLGQWKGKAPQDGLVTVVLLTSSDRTAGQAASQLRAQALTPGAYTAQGLDRTATFAVTGVSGSRGAVFATVKGASQSGSIALGVWTTGRVVGLVEVIRTTGSPRTDAVDTVRTESAHLATTLPGFTLAPTRYPALASGLWGAATAVVALLAAAGPVVVRRRRARRHQRWLEEQERLIRVGGTTVVRTRRS
jgi:hypothetical protein